MKVIDCRSDVTFNAICTDLGKKIKNSGEEYDLLVAIANGGCPVAENISINIEHMGGYLVVKRQRPGTANKERMILLKNLLKRLPPAINDRLRILEMAIAEWRFVRSRDKPRKSSAVLIIQDCQLPEESIRRILVVDDAVDSGATLVDVGRYLRERYPQSNLRFAALTITHRQPLIQPDYYVHTRSILKFPWSLDG